MKYYTYTGVAPNGSLVDVLISEQEFNSDDNAIKDYFLVNTKEIERTGEVDIEGDIHMLRDYYSAD